MVCNKALERALFVLGLVERAKNRNKTKNHIHILLFICNTIKSNSNITNYSNNT